MPIIKSHQREYYFGIQLVKLIWVDFSRKNILNGNLLSYSSCCFRGYWSNNSFIFSNSETWKPRFLEFQKNRCPRIFQTSATSTKKKQTSVNHPHQSFQNSNNSWITQENFMSRQVNLRFRIPSFQKSTDSKIHSNLGSKWLLNKKWNTQLLLSSLQNWRIKASILTTITILSIATNKLTTISKSQTTKIPKHKTHQNQKPHKKNLIKANPKQNKNKSAEYPSNPSADFL